MSTTIQLTEFLGWASILNIALLCLSTLIFMLMRATVTRMHSKMFSIPESELPLVYFKFLANYKLLIWVFCLVPYISMKCMSY
jgi:hypothetical protein